MALNYYREQEGVVITGFEGAVTFLHVPEELDGLPVRKVAKSAFARRKELRYAELPASLHVLARFAFYACPALEKVVLRGSIDDLGDGVFRQCTALREFELDLRDGNYTVLKELLAENDRRVRVTVRLPEGEACLTFPEYLLEFDEDTWARVLHTRIEGAGFAYRENVSRKGIDFRQYDRAFERIRGIDKGLASEIALNRLCRPLGLDENARKNYETFLKAESREAVRQAVSGRHEDWLRLLTDRKLLNREVILEGSRLASQTGETAMVFLLMKAAPGDGGGRMEFPD